MSDENRHETSPVMFRAAPITYLFWVITIPVGIGLAALVVWYLGNHFTRLSVTSNYVMHEFGIFDQHKVQVAIKDIRTVSVRQSLIQRILNTGSLSIYTAGDKPEVYIQGIENPTVVKKLIYAINKEITA